MKPVVVPVDKDNGRITLTKDELEKILSDAYQAGYDDGVKINTFIPPTVPNYPAVPNYPLHPYEPTITFKNTEK